MEEFYQDLMRYLESGQSVLGYSVLFAAAMLEYVFPPFPGDTITLFGGVLAAGMGWSLILVFFAVTTGSLVGSAIDYFIGLYLVKRGDRTPGGKLDRLRKRAKPVLDRFERHGAAFIGINRFLPGIRGLFFVAAGMARLSFTAAMFWGLVSTTIWNALVMTVGYGLGNNWPEVERLFRKYTTVAWVVIGLFLAFWVFRTVWKKTRSKAQARRG